MLITLKKKRVENRSKRWNTETLGWIKAVTDQKHLALYFWKHLWTSGEPFRNTYCHSWFLCWWMDYYRKRPWSFLTSLFGGCFFFFFFHFEITLDRIISRIMQRTPIPFHPDFLVVYHICHIIFYVYIFFLTHLRISCKYYTLFSPYIYFLRIRT